MSSPAGSRLAGTRGWCLAACLLCALPACRTTGSTDRDLAAPPEPGSGWREHAPSAAPAKRHAIATAHPLASDAGLEMLRAGGSALDAAIAAQWVLALVEPQSSGLGGGAFLMHWDGRALQAWDGRETAPAQVHARMFLDRAGQPVPFEQASLGGRAVGVPGAVRMLEAAHRVHGRLPWSRLAEPALRLAEGGFQVNERLAALLRLPQAQPLRSDPQASGYFFDAQGRPHPAGTVVRNPAFAAVLSRLSKEGSDALYTGAVARDVVARVRGHQAHPGALTLADLAGYQPVLREAMCTAWRIRYRVCGFPPPSSGHVTTLQILGMLEAQPGMESGVGAGLPSAAFLHRYMESARLAFADRAAYLADPAWVAPPPGGWPALLAPSYLGRRARLIDGTRSGVTAQPGQPGDVSQPVAPVGMAPDQPEFGTTHVSVVDGDGRAVSMTSTIEAAFGSRVMSDGGTGLPGGFLLNNELTDFSFRPEDDEGRPIANRVAPGKRPRSSMAPTLVFDDAQASRLLMVLGSPGGSAIIHFNAKVLLATLAWGLAPQDAIDLPNFANDNGPSRLETGRFPAATRDALRAMGHSVLEQELTSGSNVLLRHAADGGWLGGVDRRRDGAVRGD